VKPVVTTRDKVTRFLRLAARFEAGQVFIKRGVMDDLVEQLLLVPEAPHDDLVDALELAVDAATANRWVGSLPDLSKLSEMNAERRRQRGWRHYETEFGRWTAPPVGPAWMHR